jgi:hypothetical protein
MSILATGLDSPGVGHHFSEALPWLEDLLIWWSGRDKG